MATSTAHNEASVTRPIPVPRSRRRWLVPAILLVIYAAQCGWFIRTQSLTYDEPPHLIAGLEAWRDHRFVVSNDHPPLGHLLCTVLLMKNPGFQVQMHQDEHYNVEVPSILPDPEAVALRGRAMNVMLGLILGGLLWSAARRLWSDSAAHFCLALFAFSPSLIAHFSLITTDGIGTLSIFAAAWQLVRWRRNPSPTPSSQNRACWGPRSRAQLALLGVLLGGMLLAKMYTLPFFVVTLALVLVLKPHGLRLPPRDWNWGAAFTAAAIALVVLWGGYFFHTSHLTMRNGTLVATYPNAPPLVKTMRTPVRLNLWVPAGEYISGLRQMKFHNHIGHASYFLGRVSEKGSKFYYPVLVLLKWPTVVLLLALVTAALSLTGRLKLSPDWAVVAVYPVLFLAMATRASIQIGERHILPVYVFVLLFAGGAWEFARQERRRGLQWLLLLAVVANAADALRYAPDYLSYFAAFVPPAQSWKLLTDSNLDWGQGLLALRDYERQHPAEVVHLAYFGSVSPKVYGVHALALKPGERASGTVVISATELSGQLLPDPQSYRWVLQYPLKTTLNHSLLVFDVNDGQRAGP